MSKKKGPVQIKVLPLGGFASRTASPLPLLTDAEARGLVSRPWRLVSVKDGGRRLVLSLANPTELRGVQILETAKELSVTVYETPRPPGASVMSHVTAFASVLLSSPLGDRRLTGGQQEVEDGRA
jgi:hypothetical protein